MPETLSFDRWLKQRRRTLGLTQQDLAGRIGCSASTLEKLEAGVRRPSRQIAELLAGALGVAATEQAAFVEFARADPRRCPPPLPQREAGNGSSIDAGGRGGGALRSNVPRPLTALIGRDEIVAEARTYLLREEMHLLTLAGPPGIGKTRLALHLAATLTASFADGVFFVGLAPINDPELVLPAIVQTLQVRDDGTGTPLAGLVAALYDREMLLILDNFEQVLAAGPRLVDLLAACPRLKALVTSREALHVRGEQRLVVPPLALPDLARLPPAADLLAYPAVALFVERARMARPDFALSEENAEAVARICAGLDGLPLAIELLAARIQLLSPAALLARLDSRMVLATAGSRDLPARHRTLRAAIAWSYGLLAPAEQQLFARLSVFNGGCTLEAVEAVCGDFGLWNLDFGEETNIHNVQRQPAQLDLLDGLAVLVDKSLVRQAAEREGARELRFLMLETIREYAEECLAADGEDAAIRRRHAAYYLLIAEQADSHWGGREQQVWIARLEADHDNVRMALRWLLEHGETESAGRLAAALVHFWDGCSYLTEGRRWIARVLGAAAPLPARLEARLLCGGGALAHAQSDFAQATTLLESGLALWRALDDRAGIAGALNNLGLVAMDQGEFAQAARLFDECLGLRNLLGDTASAAGTLSNRGLVALYQGQTAAAVRLFEASLAVRRELGDQRGIATALANLGEAARTGGDYHRARALYTEALTVRDMRQDKLFIIANLGGLAAVAVAEGEAVRAARLFGAEATLREAIGTPLAPADQAEYDACLARLHAQLDEATFAAAWAEGRALHPEQMIDYVLMDTGVPRSQERLTKLR